MPRPVMLVILDGWGHREETADNAVAQARTPNFDRLAARWPHALLTTHGEAVGLPVGQMGNSEVGHLNIGAGRIVMQDLPRIDKAARDGDLGRRVALSGLVERLKVTGGACHLMGLMSPGGVHAHQDHAAALTKILAENGIRAFIHVFTDGRDCPPNAARGDLSRLEASLPVSAQIATVSGRYFAMDRDHRWERVERSYRTVVEAEGPRFQSLQDALEAAAKAGTTDEFVEPAAIGHYSGMRDGDALLVTNFRADRIREILDAILDPTFEGFRRPRVVKLASAVGMVSYSETLDRLMRSLFDADAIADGLSETLSAAGLRQIHLAETEKYPHVTYFFDGGVEKRSPGETWETVPSPKVATYDLKPEMSAPELGARVLAAIEQESYDFVLVNFANADMVGHTGSLPAATAAVEAVDRELGPLVDAILARGGSALVTADHGNSELMRDPATGGPHTAHTTNRVPVIVAGVDGRTVHDGILADIAPTILEMAGCRQPEAMTGRSLLDQPV